MMTRAFSCAVVIGASVLSASCLSTHQRTLAQIAINIQVAPPPASSGCSQDQLTFSQSAPTGPQYVNPCGDINLSSFSGPAPVDVSMSIVTPGFAFNAEPGKDSLAYAEKHGATKSSVRPGSRFPNGVTHTSNAADISFKYHNGRDCADHTYCPKSDYGIYLSKDGSYFEEVDPIIVNQP